MKKILEKAKKMKASEFTKFLDEKNVPWIWDDCDNILDYNEGRCVIDVIELGRMFWFEDGEFVEEIEMSY